MFNARFEVYKTGINHLLCETPVGDTGSCLINGSITTITDEGLQTPSSQFKGEGEVESYLCTSLIPKHWSVIKY